MFIEYPVHARCIYTQSCIGGERRLSIPVTSVKAVLNSAVNEW